MFFYNLRLGWISVRQTPMLSLLTIAAIGLGIAVSTTFVTVHYLMAKDPIPSHSDRLFAVRLDAWDPERAYDDRYPDRPPYMVTYRDAMALMESDIPTRHAAMFQSYPFVHPEGQSERPFRAFARVCFRDFFVMFDAPFRFGGPWTEQADDDGEAVVVLSSNLNDRLFGGDNSVGRQVRLQNRIFTVVGVLDSWRPMTKFYDTSTGAQSSPEDLFLPFRLTRPLELDSSGTTSSWQGWDGFEGLLESESIWLQFWAELETPSQREAYAQYLDAYALEQRALGRFQRPLNNRVQPLMDWLREDEVVPMEARSLRIVALLFLAVCSVNLVGLLLSKFLAGAPEVGVRRALGASRGAVFLQHLVECQLVALIGGLLGLVLSALGVRIVGRLVGGELPLALDLNMVAVGLVLALASGMIAGLYPAWMVCRIQPAVHLKLQ